MIGQKKLIIVCDEKTQIYANYLRQLISSNDDKDGKIIGVKDGTVEATVWLEKDYNANAPTVSSTEHVLFIGENKTSKKEISTMDVKFDKFGTKYGWLGKRGMMIVYKDIIRLETYDLFIEFCKQYDKNMKRIKKVKDVSLKNNDGSPNIVNIVKLIFRIKIPESDLAMKAGDIIISAAKQKDIWKQQYDILTTVFYLEGLAKFLEA